MANSRTLPKAPLMLTTIVNEAGLANGGSRGTTALKFGNISGLPRGWKIVGNGEIATDYGKLIQQGNDWKFELTKAVTHAEGRAANILVPTEKATVVVEDPSGKQYEVALRVSIVDDVVRITPISGLKGFAGDEIQSSLKINYGADGKAAENNLVLKGHTPSNVSGDIAEYTLEHGILTLNTATGAYTFKANGLGKGNAASQEITFIAKDGDGDTSSQTVKIAIEKPNLPPDFLLDTVVNEAGLNDGTTAENGTELGDFAGLPEGWEIVGAGSNTVDYGRVVHTEDGWKFELTANAKHSDEGIDILQQAEKPTIIIQDAHGNQYEVPVSINIIDDIPELFGDMEQDVKEGDSLSGVLDIKFGADGKAANGFLTINGVEPDSIDQGVATYTLEYGKLALDVEAGEYTFTPTKGAAGTEQVITFVAKDGDGDTTSFNVNVTISSKNPAPFDLEISVDESGLEGGTVSGSGVNFSYIDGLPEGWTIVKPGVSVPYGKFVSDGDSWRFELTESITHPETGTDYFSPTKKPTLIVKDSEGNEYTVPVKVQVIDDVPTVGGENTLTVKAGSSLDASMDIHFGADGKAKSGHLTVAGLDPDVKDGDKYTYNLEHGVLVLDTTSGKYTFNANANATDKAEQKVSFIIKDGDGDTESFEVSLAINNPDYRLPIDFTLKVQVDEAGLASGNEYASGHDSASILGLPEGWNIISTGSTIPYGKVIQDGNTWKFQLTNSVSHPDGQGQNSLVDNPTLKLLGPDGKEYDVPVEITVIDDAPVLASDAGSSISLINDFTSPTEVTGKVALSFGADGAAKDDALVWDTSRLGALTSKGQLVSLSQEKGVLAGTARGEIVFKLSINQDGTYKYEQLATLDNTKNLHFGLQVKDNDNDIAILDNAVFVKIEEAYAASGHNDRVTVFTDQTMAKLHSKSVVADVLANDGNPGAELVSVSSGTYGTAVVKDGKVIYTVKDHASSLGSVPVRDYITYTAKDARGMEYKNTVEVYIKNGKDYNTYTDHGNDTIYLDYAGRPLSSNESVSLGNGDNYLNIRGGNWVMNSTAITAGSGNDTITASSHDHLVLWNSTVNLGDGDNVLKIDGGSHYYNPHNRWFGVVDSSTIVANGSGNNLIEINGNGRGASANLAVFSGRITTEDGNDTLSVTVQNDTGWAIAVEGTNISTGAGDDSLSFTVKSATSDGHALYKAHVHAGHGDDIVSIDVTAKAGAYGINSSTVKLDYGNDTLVCKVNGAESAAVYGTSLIDAGDGNDYVLLEGNQYALNARTGNINILGGDGDDTIVLKGGVVGEGGILVDGGTGGHDELRFMLNDVSSDKINSMNGFLDSAKATNFESLLLDMEGGKNNTLALTDKSIEALQKSGWATVNEAGTGGNSTIYIKGDSYDIVDLSKTNGTWQQTGETTLHDGVVYNHWVDDNNHDLYITQQIHSIVS